MAEKTLKTRIVLKNDDFQTWQDSSLILKKGEIALVKVPSPAQGPNSKNNSYDTPTYLMKVGDGQSTFAALKWVAANAADVYAWAKKEKMDVTDIPTIPTSKIEKLDEAVKATVNDMDLASNSGFSSHINNKSNPHGVTAGQVGLGKVANKSPSELKADFIATDIAAEDQGFATGDMVYGFAHPIDEKITNHIANKKNPHGVDAEQVGLGNVDNKSAATLKTEFTSKGIATGDAGFVTAAMVKAADYASKTEAQGYANAKDSAIATAKKAGTDAQAYAEGVNTKVENIKKDYLVKADKTALEQADAKQVKRIETLEDQITGLTGAMHFKGVVEKLPANTNGYEAGDVIIVDQKEYVANIETKEFVELGDTTEEGKAINALKERVDVIQGNDSTAGSINKALKDAKAYADDKVQGLANGQVNTNKNDIAAINDPATGILHQAKEYTNGKDTAMNTRVAALEAKETAWDTGATKASTALQKADIATGTANGTIKVKDTNVAVKGLGSAAYTNSNTYATAVQGGRADTAIQTADHGVGLTTSVAGANGAKKLTIDIDDSVTFILDCGTSAVQ